MRSLVVIYWVSTVAMLAIVGCGPSSVPSSGTTGSTSNVTVNTELQGNVAIDGSSTVYLISEAVASQFRKQYPNVGINIGESGSGEGFKRLAKGEIDIADASRPIGAEEFAAAKANHVTFIELPVAYDGLTIVVHPSNTWVDSLTIDEIKKIYVADVAVKSWSEVRAGWPDKPIKPFAPGTSSGTFDYFKEVVAGKTSSLRSDMSTSEDDNVIVTGVAGTPEAIGFFGFAYFDQNKDKLKAVPILNPTTNELVAPSSQTIESGEYAPFSRPLFIYVNNQSAARPEVKRLVTFYLENAAAIAKQIPYVALPDAVSSTALENFQARKLGTHYLTSDGEKRSGRVMEVYQATNLLGFE